MYSYFLLNALHLILIVWSWWIIAIFPVGTVCLIFTEKTSHVSWPITIQNGGVFKVFEIATDFCLNRYCKWTDCLCKTSRKMYKWQFKYLHWPRTPACVAVWAYIRWAGSRVLLSSAPTTAVRGCRGALMSCIMGVRRDAGMEGKSEGAETRSLPCAALRCAAQTVGEG